MVRENTQMIGVKPSTKKRLEDLGTLRDTFDSVIVKLLDSYEKHK